jgi:hypothetical protein
MFSMPPATTTSTSPARIICDAIATDLKPDPQSMLIVVAGLFRDPGADRDLTRLVLPESCLQHAAEHDLINILAGNTDPINRRARVGGSAGAPALACRPRRKRQSSGVV